MALPQVQCLHKRRSGEALVSPYYTVSSDCVLYHAYWDGTAVDHSSYGNNGTVTSGSYTTTGLTFDGLNTWVEVPATMTPPGTGDISCVAWINPLANLDGAEGMLFAAGSAWNTYVMFNTYQGDPGHGYFALVVGNAFKYYAFAANLFPRGAWVMLAYVVDRDNTDGMPFVYKNGAVVAETWTGVASDNDFNYSRPIPAIGGYNLLYGTVAGHFHGEIGEIYVFNSAKSSAEIAALYNATKSRYGVT